MSAIRHGAIHAFLAVAAGAFGAHGLQQVLDDYSLKVWQTAATYQLAHALALILLGVLEEQRRIRLNFAHAAFGIGIVIFSGSLYALALSGVKTLGMITPLGGLAFLAGWASLAWKAQRV
jgi:uncharacterized membrane protein YgdD (TMEM256/DUF423 family)